MLSNWAVFRSTRCAVRMRALGTAQSCTCTAYTSQVEHEYAEFVYAICAQRHGTLCTYRVSIRGQVVHRMLWHTRTGTCTVDYIYTYKRVVCVYLFACLSVFFLSATRHLSTLRRCLRVAERAGAAVASGPALAAGKHALARARARMSYIQLLNEKIAALMPFKNKTVRARACCRIRNYRDFQKKGKRKPTCHFPSSVYSLPSLGVFTFRIVLNRT